MMMPAKNRPFTGLAFEKFCFFGFLRLFNVSRPDKKWVR
jgi:hypothetical protein